MAQRNSVLDVNLVVEAHEDRLQRLEASHGEVSKGLAENTVALQFLTEKMDDMAKNISDKIDACITPVAAKISQHIDDDKDLYRDMADIKTTAHKVEDRLTSLEKPILERQERWKAVKKAGWTLLIAGAGAVITELAKMLLVGLGVL